MVVEIASAFEKHVVMYKGLDICINCAGTSSHLPFHAIATAGIKSWKHVLDINLNAVINCTALAVHITQNIYNLFYQWKGRIGFSCLSYCYDINWN